ncbi:PREDICTED: DNA repair protein REV1 [Wasmannia auropunctata]|uniref:DNA repair protein REV1 n=1 Tax=Wasmannia auropunctata TaxID=64793 RepID=UPI0005F0A0DF|nr:PREDICTED: DNA repair protein REV1 [Wasmannia auropunctata]XP_011701620.1 PREDICTED: DNA repair protein REV1 [Wasmannia auropunctata]XP_011701621.1 PREDICTED: DNA repair protein REV1 [Wasmannia auropunctata]
MSKKKRDHDWAENGFEEWGGYMAAKKAKLEEQFRKTASKEFNKESSKLLEGIAIFVNGYTDPTSDELRRIMMTHGGMYHHYMRPKITTHIIASNLPYSKIMMYRRSQNPIPICKPQWIVDSIAAGKILNFQNYLLYSNSTSVQPQLAYKLSNGDKNNASSIVHDERDTEKPEASADTVRNETDTSNGNSSKDDACNGASRQDATNSCQSSNTRTGAQSTRDAEFLSAFYSNSRLHYISTMGTTFKDYVNELRDKSDGVFSGLERLIKLRGTRNASVACESDSEDEAIFTDKITSKTNRGQRPVVMHIDMDCFFVSVGIRSRPELHDAPVAVAHAKGNTFSANHDGREEFGSMSEVASCSYAAREAGVRNGMFLGEALKLCPNLRTIQYDFEGYKEVSYVLYNTVASYTLDIEAVSCDEMYVDCTKILEASGLSPLEFATIIRNEIKRKTDCPVSTGFGSNKLQARLATRKAKPDNQFYLSDRNAETFIRSFSIRDLPGVGGTTTYKLRKMNVHTCEDLQKISLGVLQKEFGKKMGEQLYKMCRGLDDTKLNLEYVRKSVSAEVNYGIRFQNNGDAVDFLSELSVEVCNRLTAARAKGRCITLKLMVRAEEAPKETPKFMGHGLCNYITKSKNLIAAVDDVSIIKKEVINIWNQLHLIPEDMRGIGIQISRLEICKTKQAKSNLINFFNKTKRSQPIDKTLGDDNKDTRCVSDEKSEPDCSEVPSTTESLAIKKNCDTEISNLPLESAKSSNGVDSEIPVSVQVEPSTFVAKSKSKKLHNSKVNKNTKVKEMLGKSNKKVMQRQTSQENFFKQVKPNGGRSSKYAIPQMHDLDMSVLVELPADIRNEIFDEYKRNKKQAAISAASRVDPVNEVKYDEESSNVQNCSQVDPDVLLALMENDLHPDVQRDVQMYCDMKREANRANSKETNEKSDSERLQETNAISSKINDNKENAILVKSTCTNKPERIPQENAMHAGDQLCEKHDAVEATSTSCRIDHVDTSHNNVTMDKADTFILQNLSILHNNENVDKHHEMLINLVNHLFTLPLQQVKLQIQTWVTKSNVVNEVDFLSLATFLSMLPGKKRIEDLHILLKTMHRCTTKTGNCIWHRTYRRTVKHVQRYMQIEYNNNLMVPLIRCNDPRCDNDN